MPKPVRVTDAALSAAHVEGDDRNAFQRRARLLQSLWRDDRGFDCGLHVRRDGSTRLLGSRLLEADAKRGGNFLTPSVYDLVRAELLTNERRGPLDKKLLEPRRLLGDLLSSQPMCFNLFGELALDRELATEVLRRLWPDLVDRVLDVRFEWSPGRLDDRYLGNRSAADAFVEFADTTGGRSFIAIETKYHEDMKSPAGRWKPRYDELLVAHPIVGRDERLHSGRLQQVLLDHLLAVSLLAAPDGWNRGIFVLLYPEPNYECQAVADEYAGHLTELGAESYQALTLERFVEALDDVSSKRWIRDFRQRYLDWERVPQP